MKRSKWLATGFMTLFAAWLFVGQASFVYAADPAATPPTGTTTTTTAPAADPSATSTPTSTANTDLPGGDYTNPTDTTGYVKPTCNVPYFGWIVCPFINVAVETIAKISKYVVEMLEVAPLTQSSGLFKVWEAFRNLADVGFILIFLMLIFGNLIGSENSSYQLKSLLPKLIIAAILVQFSFYITAFIIDIGNVSGAGVGAIVSQLGTQAGTAKDVSTGLSAGQYHVGDAVVLLSTSAVAVAGVAILTWPVVLLMIGGFLLSVLGVFFTLALRQLIIAILIVLSPLAMAAFVLPNTEHFFKHWYTNLVRVILIFPMIVILLSVGGALARLANDTNGLFRGSKAVNQIFASIIPILVFLAIPATFKAASGLMSRVSSGVFNRHDRIKNQFGGSQLRKDLKEARQEKGFIAQRDATGKFGRGLGRARAGQIGLGQPGRRRLAKGYDAAIGAQMKDWGIRFDDLGLGNADLMNDVVLAGHGNNFTYTARDGSTKTEKITKAMQAQAIGQIAKQGGNVEINKIIDNIYDPSQKNWAGDYKAGIGLPNGREAADTWFRGMGASGVMPQVIQAIPMTNPGKRNKAYDGLSASQVAKIHGSGWDKYLNRITAPVGTDANPLDISTGQKERVRASLYNFKTIAGSAEQRSTVDQTLMREFKREAMNASSTYHTLLSNEYVKDLRDRNLDISGVDFFRKYVTDDGKISPDGIPGII